MVMLKPTTPTDKEFECKNPSYTEYYRVSAFDDIKDKIGQIWLCMYRKKVIGFVSIAMAHMRPRKRQTTTERQIRKHSGIVNWPSGNP